MNGFQETRGLVFDIRRNSFHDGPGIRTTVFLKGCPLSCAWCHNPEGLSPLPELLLRPARCVSCGACDAACPKGFRPRDLAAGGAGAARDRAYPRLNGPGEGEGSPAKADSAPCLGCAAPCAEACPSEALQLIGRGMALAELMAELRADKVFYDSSGGGVTFSGGEPLAQAGFLSEALDACRAEGIRTAIETSAYAKPGIFMGVAKKADLLLLDLKVLDAARHRAYTGRSNFLILENIRSAAKAGLAYALRVPLVPGFTDYEAGLEALADFALGLEANWREARKGSPKAESALEASAEGSGAPAEVQLPAGAPGVRPEIHILPYHDAGKTKYAARRLPYLAEAAAVPERGRLEAAALIFSKRGLCVRIGG
jgi:pyruvate formate lyase activating enzyme